MIHAWGDNELATLGLGEKSRVKTTPQLTLPTWKDILEVEASASHTSGRFPDGRVEVVGGNLYDAACDGQPHTTRAAVLLQPSVCQLPPARAFSLCESAGCIVRADGTIETWSGNIFGQIGIGTWSEGKERLDPPGVYPTPQKPMLMDPVLAVGGGQYHKLAITTSGLLVAWGRNDAGELGDGTNKVKLTPTHVEFGDLIAVDGGGKHSLLLRGDGIPFGMGRGKQAQFGTLGEPDRLTPTPIGIEGVRAIAAGGSTSLFLMEDGTVLKCGRERPLEKVDLPGICTAISAGTSHNLYVVDGQAYGEGKNEFGQVGDGTRTVIVNGVVKEENDKPTPVPLGIEAVEVSAGVIHSVARA